MLPLEADEFPRKRGPHTRLACARERSWYDCAECEGRARAKGEDQAGSGFMQLRHCLLSCRRAKPRHPSACATKDDQRRRPPCTLLPILRRPTAQRDWPAAAARRRDAHAPAACTESAAQSRPAPIAARSPVVCATPSCAPDQARHPRRTGMEDYFCLDAILAAKPRVRSVFRVPGRTLANLDRLRAAAAGCGARPAAGDLAGGSRVALPF